MGEWIRRWTMRLLTLIVFAFVGTVGWLFFDGVHDSYRTVDCAVILGEPLGSDGKPTAELRQRLDHVAGLLKAGTLKSAVLAAEMPASEAKTTEDGMSRYLGEQGVPAGTVMQDLNGPTPETMGADIAGYMNSVSATSVVLVANFADITLNKMALRDAGIATVETWHTGTPKVSDGPAMAKTALIVWKNVFEKDVAPEAKKLVAQAQTGTQNMINSTEAKGTAEAKKAADVPDSK